MIENTHSRHTRTGAMSDTVVAIFLCMCFTCAFLLGSFETVGVLYVVIDSNGNDAEMAGRLLTVSIIASVVTFITWLFTYVYYQCFKSRLQFILNPGPLGPGRTNSENAHWE
jgi:hypothetical protein